MIRTGKRNLITDVAGIRVGQAESALLRSGVTTVFPESAAVAAVDVRGGGPGTRETEVLGADCLVDRIHAIVLSGGSAFGLAAADGVMSWLAQKGIGFRLGEAIIPIVPAAILFDLLNGGDKSWGEQSPYFDLGRQSVSYLQDQFDLGNAGAGLGATAGDLKGGLGSASCIYEDGNIEITVGALAAVNPLGSVTLPDSDVMWAAAYERDGELGGQGVMPADYRMPVDYDFPDSGGTNTTLVVVATDAKLGKAECKRIAIMAQDGLARAIRPVHTPFDGDTVFALSTGKKQLTDATAGLARLGMLAADCVTRAIARGVYEAESLGEWQSYRARHGHTPGGE